MFFFYWMRKSLEVFFLKQKIEKRKTSKGNRYRQPERDRWKKWLAISGLQFCCKCCCCLFVANVFEVVVAVFLLQMCLRLFLLSFVANVFVGVIIIVGFFKTLLLSFLLQILFLLELFLLLQALLMLFQLLLPFCCKDFIECCC